MGQAFPSLCSLVEASSDRWWPQHDVCCGSNRSSKETGQKKSFDGRSTKSKSLSMERGRLSATRTNRDVYDLRIIRLTNQITSCGKLVTCQGHARARECPVMVFTCIYVYVMNACLKFRIHITKPRQRQHVKTWGAQATPPPAPLGSLPLLNSEIITDKMSEQGHSTKSIYH